VEDKKLFETCEALLAKRSSLLNLWQEISENFYPERADFTAQRNTGDTFADNLTTSYPILMRRDLGNAFSSMLRPVSKEWFYMTVEDENSLDHDAKQWLEQVRNVQRRAMYARSSKFVRATKEADHDFASFGQCVVSVELNRDASGLLYRCWHLRDMAWAENEQGDIGTIIRRWKPTVRDLMRFFKGENLHPETVRQANINPFEEADIRHIVVEADLVDGNFTTPYVSLYYDAEHFHVIEKVGVNSQIYVIPRWQTVSGSQYAFSPATVAALPDARLLQSLSYTLLEAGEKAANPPMIAVQEAIRSDVSIYAGGITWVDASYDERLGEVLRPLTQDKQGLPAGLEMQRDTRSMLAEAFFLNKLVMPARGPEMTAYEVGQRVQQYIRDALPLFEPMEEEYNGAICEATFDLMLRAGAFGSPLDIPSSLRGQNLQFKFESPLHDAIEREKGNKLIEAQQLMATTIQLDPAAGAILNAREALRDVLEGIGVPAKWMRDRGAVEEIAAQQAQAAAQQQAIASLGEGAEAATKLGTAQQQFQDASTRQAIV
jgi:hypothetical protein